MKTWKNTLRNAKVVLMHQLKEKDKAIYSELHKEIFTDITKSLDDFLEISDICDLAQFLIEEENKLFNPRITKFVKVSKHHVTSKKKNNQLNNQRQLFQVCKIPLSVMIRLSLIY